MIGHGEEGDKRERGRHGGERVGEGGNAINVDGLAWLICEQLGRMHVAGLVSIGYRVCCVDI